MTCPAHKLVTFWGSAFWTSELWTPGRPLSLGSRHARQGTSFLPMSGWIEFLWGHNYLVVFGRISFQKERKVLCQGSSKNIKTNESYQKSPVDTSLELRLLVGMRSQKPRLNALPWKMTCSTPHKVVFPDKKEWTIITSGFEPKIHDLFHHW